ncbi:MAG: sulfurtransferase TusA family protein [Actinomycetia bacterium]|nr:sulfurtransferase TusA family protein [Actinomycetes bacterium]
MNEINIDQELDCIGLFCPAPIYETRKKINSMKEGQVLKMTADDPGSEADIKSWAKTTGNELFKIEKEGETFIFYIKKTSG